MISVIDATDKTCVIYWVGPKGFKVKVITYCGVETNLQTGARQVLPQLLDKDPKLCTACRAAIEATQNGQ